MCYTDLRRSHVWNHKCKLADLMDNVSIIEFSIILGVFFGLLLLTFLEKICVFIKSSPYFRDILRNGPHNDLSVGLLRLGFYQPRWYNNGLCTKTEF
jgi:hypothetical protein